jgi:paraquat-inducible protein B
VTIKSSRLLPWLMPVIAAIAAAFLLIREVRSKGATLVLRADRNAGLEVDVSKLRYRGVECGRVTDIRLDPEASEVKVEVTIERWAEQLAREGSKFWVVTPKLEVGRVRGLEALRSGAYVTVDPGEGPEQTEFDMLPEAPAVAADRAGQRYLLFAKQTHGIQPGAPIYYRGLTIGTVVRRDLVNDTIRFELHVDRPYIHLLKNETKFWPTVALRADVGILGAEFETGTLESFWSGGVTIATPPNATKIRDDTTYWLAPEPDDDWQAWIDGDT